MRRCEYGMMWLAWAKTMRRTTMHLSRVYLHSAWRPRIGTTFTDRDSGTLAYAGVTSATMPIRWPGLAHVCYATWESSTILLTPWRSSMSLSRASTTLGKHGVGHDSGYCRRGACAGRLLDRIAPPRSPFRVW